MSNKQYIFDFLEDLRQNNSKDWMDENRKRYHKAKEIWVAEVEQIIQRLQQHDRRMEQLPAKSTLASITNNRMFHPNKPVYKTFFAFTPLKAKHIPSFHISISPESSFLGGGFYHPDKEKLDKIRAGIDYDGEELVTIVNTPAMQEFFGGLAIDEQQLKTAPQAYDITHRHIALLRRKSFTAIRPLTKEEVLSSDFVDLVEQGYLAVRPLLDYLDKVVNFEG